MALPDDWQAKIHEGQELRGWIVNSFAQVEYLLGDLILRCAGFVEYEQYTRTLPHGAADRVKRVRRMLETTGPLDEEAGELLLVLNDLIAQQDVRNLLVHGFATVLHTPAGEFGFHFQKFHRHPTRQDARLIQTFTLDRLRELRTEQSASARNAVDLFQRIHIRLGWNGPMSDEFHGDRPFER